MADTRLCFHVAPYLRTRPCLLFPERGVFESQLFEGIGLVPILCYPPPLIHGSSSESWQSGVPQLKELCCCSKPAGEIPPSLSRAWEGPFWWAVHQCRFLLKYTHGLVLLWTWVSNSQASPREPRLLPLVCAGAGEGRPCGGQHQPCCGNTAQPNGPE